MHINRYWNYGLSFRWVQGDNYVVVKRGYVIEGQASVQVSTRPIIPGVDIQDLPGVKVGHDQDTWLTWFQLDSSHWNRAYALNDAADKWAQANPQIADLRRVIRYPRGTTDA